MIAVVRDEATGHFRIVSTRAETLGIARTRAAADDLADLLLEAWEEAVAAAVARARMKHGAAIIEPR
ncbi:hypothetical protein [Neoroseomonas alkaliterrae]|uniref:hypothetical protein n=1 Tax=Neoroseomonas alkaliterrae TaxID=1452450 RepID=UPI00160DE4B3|nr:hypothetical protein [Neoroseomonas alkaliterrae]